MEDFPLLNGLKLVVTATISFVVKELREYGTKRKGRLRADYSFAETFMIDSRWKSMSDDSLERAYEALSGVRVDGFIIRFFLLHSQKNSLKNLFDYAVGKSFLVAEGSKEKIILRFRKSLSGCGSKHGFCTFFSVPSVYFL